MNYEENDYNQQYEDLKLLLKNFNGESILNLLITNQDLKTKKSIETIDLKHQPDNSKKTSNNSKRSQLFQEYGTDRDNDRLFLILIRRTEIELIGDGNKLIEVKVI